MCLCVANGSTQGRLQESSCSLLDLDGGRYESSDALSPAFWGWACFSLVHGMSLRFRYLGLLLVQLAGGDGEITLECCDPVPGVL